MPNMQSSDNGIWIPPNKAICISGIEIPDGMIYVGTNLTTHRNNVDPCLIDISKEVSESDIKTRKRIGHFPSYSTMTKEMRKTYLKWLAQGRCDPKTEIGYVLTYLYGLERRVAIDSENKIISKKEWPIIAKEAIRLLNIYGKTSSTFAVPAIRLWSYISLKNSPSLANLLHEIQNFPRTYEFPICLQYILSKTVKDKSPLLEDIAYEWIRLDPIFSKYWTKIDLYKNFENSFKKNYNRKSDNAHYLADGGARLNFLYSPSSVEWRTFQGIRVKLNQNSTISKSIESQQTLHEIIESSINENEIESIKNRNIENRIFTIDSPIIPKENKLLILDGTCFQEHNIKRQFAVKTESNQLQDIIFLSNYVKPKIPAAYGICIFEIDDKNVISDYASTAEPLIEIVHLLGWRVLLIPSKDVTAFIATLATDFAKAGKSIDILTLHEELMQLISDNINIINPKSGKRYDKRNVLAEMGVTTSKLVEYWALSGNRRNSILGVKFITAKIAAKLLNNYDSIDGIIRNGSHVRSIVINSILANPIQINGNLEKLTVSKTLDLNNYLESDYSIALKFKAVDQLKIATFYLNNKLYNEAFALSLSCSEKWIKDQLPFPRQYKNQTTNLESNFIVYRIRNLKTNRIYFGSSGNISVRWQTHKGELKRNIHSNFHIGEDVKIYGIDSFEFRIISRHKNRNEMLSREQLYISMFYGRNCYNYARYVEFHDGLPLSTLVSVQHIDYSEFTKTFNSSVVSASDKGYGQYISIHAASKAVGISKFRIKSGLKNSDSCVIDDWVIRLVFESNPNQVGSNSKQWHPSGKQI